MTNSVMRQSDVVTLRDHVDALLLEMDKRYNQQFEAQEKAVRTALDAAQVAGDKHEQGMKEWKASTNEWRGAMNDREKNFMTRNTWEATHESLCKRVDDLEKKSDLAQGKATQGSVLWVGLMTLLSLMISLIRIIK